MSASSKTQLITVCYLAYVIIWGVNLSSLSSLKSQEISSKNIYPLFPKNQRPWQHWAPLSHVASISQI